MRACLLFLFVVASFRGMGQRAEHYSNKFLPKKDSAGGSSAINIDSAAFCNVLNQFMVDASRNFSRVKGNVVDNTAEGVIYSANRGLPGTITSSVVSGKGWRYEGVVYQGKSKEDMNNAYLAYKRLLDKCMAAGGYESSSEKNTTKGMENNPSIKYSKPSSAALYAMLKAEYADINAVYTVTVDVINN